MNEGTNYQHCLENESFRFHSAPMLFDWRTRKRPRVLSRCRTLRPDSAEVLKPKMLFASLTVRLPQTCSQRVGDPRPGVRMTPYIKSSLNLRVCRRFSARLMNAAGGVSPARRRTLWLRLTDEQSEQLADSFGAVNHPRLVPSNQDFIFAINVFL